MSNPITNLIIKYYYLIVLLAALLIIASCEEENEITKLAPTVSKGTVTNVTKTSATINASITDDGHASVTARGIVWSTNENPTTDDDKTTDGTGIGEFTGELTGLTANTLYHARAYATNEIGTSYGEEITFTTNDLPQVATGSASSISNTSAQIEGNVTFDGNTTVTDRGFVWSVNHNPTIADTKISDGSGTGTFSETVSGLAENTTYYIRAYATNSQGTAYGSEVEVLTLAQPVVTTTGVTNLSILSVTIDGNVTFDGNTDVTDYGICWSANHNPTTADNVVAAGNGTGAFSGSIEGLTANSTYYARAYAVNSVGVSYSDEVTISTPNITGLKAHYTFNSTLADNTGNNNNGIAGDGVSYTIDRYNNASSAMYFNGATTATVSTAVVMDNTSAMSMSFWFKASESTGAHYFVYHSKFMLYYVMPGAYFAINGTPGTSGMANCLAGDNFLNTWHHMVGVYTGGVMTIYIDGQATASDNFNTGPVYGAMDFIFGGSGGAAALTGSLDEVKIYNRALSADEVTYLYQH